MPAPPDAPGTAHLCPYHFARYLAVYPGTESTLRESFAVDDHTPDHVLLSLEESPETVDDHGSRYRRMGLDQQGRVHYYSDAGHDVQVRDAVGRIERREGLGPRPLAAWVAFVADRRGWVALDQEVTPDAV